MYRINQVSHIEQVMSLLLHKIQREEELRGINDTLQMAAPELVAQAYANLEKEKKIIKQPE